MTRFPTVRSHNLTLGTKTMQKDTDSMILTYYECARSPCMRQVPNWNNSEFGCCSTHTVGWRDPTPWRSILKNFYHWLLYLYVITFTGGGACRSHVAAGCPLNKALISSRSCWEREGEIHAVVWYWYRSLEVILTCVFSEIHSNYSTRVP